MSERLSGTAHGDAPLTAAFDPVASASTLSGTHDDDELIGRTITIARSVEELYVYWRELSNLPRILGDDEFDWDAMVIEEVPGRAIAWSLPPQSERRVSGRVDFREAPAGRGTEVSVTIASEPRGVIGKAIDKLTHHDPKIEARRALRRFKQLMETGEISTAQPPTAAPRG